MRCTRCQTALYCSRECQVAHWKKGADGGHKKECPQLQAKKIGKGEQKANSKLMSTVLTELTERNLSFIAGNAAQMLSDPNAVHMSRDRRAMLQNFVRQMESFKNLDLQARSAWLANPENNKNVSDVMDALRPTDAEFQMAEALIESGERTGDPFMDNILIVGKYIERPSSMIIGTKQPESNNQTQPKSGIEIMVQAIEPILGVLDALFHQMKHLLSSSSANAYLSKLAKLKAKVQEYSSMKTSDQRAYTPDSLFTLQETWKMQVNELFTMAIGVGSAARMQGRGFSG